MRRIVDAFAEYERLLIGARTRAAMREKKSRGQRVGNVAFGFQVGDDGSRVVPCEAEQEVVALIRRHRAAGPTLEAIAADLNASGYRTRRGTQWRHQYVRAVLQAA